MNHVKGFFLGCLAVALCAIAWPALLLPVGAMAYGLVMAMAFMHGVAFLVPLLLAGLGAGYALLGLPGVWMAGLMLVLPLLSVRLAWKLNMRFWEIAGLGALLIVFGLLGSYLVIVAHMGDPFESVTNFLLETPLLNMEAEEYRRLIADEVAAARANLPNITIQTALLGGASMAYFPVVFMQRRGVTLRKVKPLAQWRMPLWARISIWCVFVCSWVALLSGWEMGGALNGAATMLVVLCYGIEGYAVCDTFLKQRGMSQGARTALLMAAFCFVRIVLAIAGLLATTRIKPAEKPADQGQRIQEPPPDQDKTDEPDDQDESREDGQDTEE